MAKVKDGIMLFTTGRAGSSMVAGIFNNHGVWTGDCRMQPSEHNAKGFFENMEIKKLQRKIFKNDIEGPLPIYDPKWEGIVQGVLDSQEAHDPWLFKTGAFWYPVWKPICNKFVRIVRPKKDILFSYNRCNFLPRHDVKYIVERQLEMLYNDIDGPLIDTTLLVKGDHGQVKEALEYCGITYHKEIVDDFVDPDLYRL